MNARGSGKPLAAFDALVCMAVLVCLCAALGVIALLLAGASPGVPFKPRLVARLVIWFQVWVLLGGAGIPGLVLLARHQFAMTPLARRLLLAAVLGLGVELVVFWASRSVGASPSRNQRGDARGPAFGWAKLPPRQALPLIARHRRQGYAPTSWSGSDASRGRSCWGCWSRPSTRAAG